MSTTPVHRVFFLFRCPSRGWTLVNVKNIIFCLSDISCSSGGSLCVFTEGRVRSGNWSGTLGSEDRSTSRRALGHGSGDQFFFFGRCGVCQCRVGMEWRGCRWGFCLFHHALHKRPTRTTRTHATQLDTLNLCCLVSSPLSLVSCLARLLSLVRLLSIVCPLSVLSCLCLSSVCPSVCVCLCLCLHVLVRIFHVCKFSGVQRASAKRVHAWICAPATDRDLDSA